MNAFKTAKKYQFLIHFHTFHFVSDPENPKLKTIKNVLNLTMINTVTVEFGGVSIGMYLMPFFFSITISNVIMVLQFNNVI